MKNHTYTFSIAKPCAESWLQMTPAEKGNFCKNCQKEVIDFSSMKDEDIIHFIKEAKGSVCGRFRNTQLNRPMRLLYQNVQRPYPLKTILAGVVALTLLQPLSAEASGTTVKQEMHEVKADTESEEILRPNLPGNAPVLKGRLLSSIDSLPIAKAMIYIQHSTLSTTTDSTGRFTITLPDSLIGKDFKLEVISSEMVKGYFSVTAAEVSSNKEQSFFLYNEFVLMDGIIIVEFDDGSKKKPKKKNNR